MLPWVERPTLTIDLDRVRRGEGLALPPEAIASARTLLTEVSATIPKKARVLAYLLALRTGNRFGREFKAAARVVDADPRDIALANLSYDLVVGALGCSTVALPTPDGPVIARNMDWWPEGPLARASYVIRCVTGDRWRFTSAGFPGAVGLVTALSANGFAIILNAVSSDDPVCKTGYPVMLHIRRVIEDAENFADAQAMLSKQKLTTSALFTLVGTRNEERVVIERAPKRFALRHAKADEPLITTNHYLILDRAQTHPTWGLGESACSRFNRLQDIVQVRNNAELPTNDELLYWLTDQHVRQEITAQHVIIRPLTGELGLWIPRRLA